MLVNRWTPSSTAISFRIPVTGATELQIVILARLEGEMRVRRAAQYVVEHFDR